MSLDARLDLFSSRLLKPDSSSVEDLRGYITDKGIINQVVEIGLKFQKPFLESSLPRVNEIRRISDNRTQKFISIPDWNDDNFLTQCGGANLPTLLNQINVAADLFATSLFLSAERDYKNLYRLEVPEGGNVSFWLSPVRVILVYDINIDSYHLRVDVIGEDKEPSTRSYRERFENVLKLT